MKASNEGIVMKAPPPHAAERFFKGESMKGAVCMTPGRLPSKMLQRIAGVRIMGPTRMAGDEVATGGDVSRSIAVLQTQMMG